MAPIINTITPNENNGELEVMIFNIKILQVLINNFYLNMESKLCALFWCQILENSLFLCGAISSTLRPYQFQYLQNICILMFPT